MNIKQQLWTYKGVDVFRADRNSYGLRWYARLTSGTIRTDTKERMRQFINARTQPATPAEGGSV